MYSTQNVQRYTSVKTLIVNERIELVVVGTLHYITLH